MREISGKGERERERERDRETERQRDRQTERDRQTDRQTEKNREKTVDARSLPDETSSPVSFFLTKGLFVHSFLDSPHPRPPARAFVRSFVAQP